MLTAVLRDALRNNSAEVHLDIAALELAAIEFPGLDFEASLFRLDNFAEQIHSHLRPGASGLDFIRIFNLYLFDHFQFRGNDGEYYDPRNSCLNSVISRRTGIPISLSVVYIEIARRLSRPITGVGLPGHFIVSYSDESVRYFIDPFHSGRVLSFDDCRTLALGTANVDIRMNPDYLQPVGSRQILIRMLTNLKTIYIRGRALDKARQVLDLLIHAEPENPEEYRVRGLIHVQQLKHRAAKADLEAYLHLAPTAPERHQVEQQLILIERWKAGLN
jgi:regulator of sirC expression with transglutaminase-like and TPR domain